MRDEGTRPPAPPKTAVLFAIALLASGCSLIWGPDPGRIEPFDGSVDGGFDAGVDGGHDFDAGDATDGCAPMGEEMGAEACGDGIDNDCDGRFDCGDEDCADVAACCVPSEEAGETTCNDDVDNDCDGLTDCADSDCASDGVCCMLDSGAPWGDLTGDYNFWDAHGAAIPSVSEVEFGPGAVGQVVHRTCAPLAFGMRLEAEFRVNSGTGDGDDYAAVLLAPVDTPRGGGDMTLLADLAVRVTRDDGVVLERAGSEIARTTVMSITGAIVQVDLQPSVDAARRPVLVMTVRVTPNGGALETLADEAVLMPLSDLRGDDAGCAPDGLYLAFEGRGSGVEVSDLVSARTGNCPNPPQFLPDQGGPLGESDILEPGAWRMGGAGEPALLTSGDPNTVRIDLHVDAAEDERSDEDLAFVDYSIGGSFYGSATWQQRTNAGAGNLLGPAPSSREPTQVLPSGVSSRIIAWAQPHRMTQDFEIHWGELDPGAAASPSLNGPLLLPGDNDGTPVDCDSLRDPALVALDAEGAPADRPNLLLFFTCHTETASDIDTIGVARFDYDMVDGVYDLIEVDHQILGASLGGYASRGYFSPEVAVVSVTNDSPTMATYALRMWFLVSDGAGRVRVAHAFGDVRTGELPHLLPYPGNPVLDPEAASLGGACALGCTIESLSVAATEGRSPLWAPAIDPSYLFLIERRVYRTDGVDHELVPLRQPRPAGG